MKRRIFLQLLFAVCCGQPTIQSLCAQTAPGIDSLARKVEHFGQALPQEKVYLHIDNTCYFVGDTIWYKGYVTRSDRGTLTNLSRILYVELLTPDGYLVERQQLPLTDGTAHGAFTLTDSLYAGYYELRAYTRWMLNFGKNEHPHSQYTEDMFYNEQMAKDFFRDYDKLYSRVFPVFDKPQEAGHYPKDMTLRPMRRYYKSRKGKPEIDLRFYPEGGHLVEGTDNRIAFELNDEDGQHLQAELSVRNSNGQEVARTPTLHRGRGMFTLPAAASGGACKALLHYAGNDYEVPLPEAEPDGYTLHVTQDSTALRIGIAGRRPAESTASGPLGLQVLHGGVPRLFRAIQPDATGKSTLMLPTDSLPTGVNQITLFDGDGRIYADRLIFVNHQEYHRPQITMDGIKNEYAPFEPIELTFTLTQPSDTAASVSLAVRDHATDELTYDNGTMLTEMLLASELKGFVEAPAYYFEADDSTHRTALDLLMMVQGWRRYDWQMMAGTSGEPIEITLPERLQTLTGSVNRTYPLLQDADYGEAFYFPPLGKDFPFYTSATDPTWNLQHLYGTDIRKMKKEVRVEATFVQGTDIVEAELTTEGHRFNLLSPRVYGEHILFLGASDTTKSMKYLEKQQTKGFMDEEAYPDFYVKLDPFYPVFPKPYSYYHDAAFEGPYDTDSEGGTGSFTDRMLSTVTVRSRRGGLRKLNLSKPAVVVDAYEAFNLTADYGLNGGMYDWRTFSRQVATAFVGDMGLDRHYFLQERYDGRALNLKPGQQMTTSEGEQLNTPSALFSMTDFTRRKYHYLRNLDKLYIYTDYAPREQGSWKYEQDNQPEVIIDYRLLPGDAVRPTYRDRRYVRQGYAVCTDFYSPDYSQRPLPDVKDHRRTLLWLPRLTFDANGQATVRLYNNSKTSVLSVEAEGITTDGRPVVWKTDNLSFRP